MILMSTDDKSETARFVPSSTAVVRKPQEGAADDQLRREELDPLPASRPGTVDDEDMWVPEFIFDSY